MTTETKGCPRRLPSCRISSDINHVASLAYLSAMEDTGELHGQNADIARAQLHPSTPVSELGEALRGLGYEGPLPTQDLHTAPDFVFVGDCLLWLCQRCGSRETLGRRWLKRLRLDSQPTTSRPPFRILPQPGSRAPGRAARLHNRPEACDLPQRAGYAVAQCNTGEAGPKAPVPRRRQCRARAAAPGRGSSCGRGRG